MSETHKLFNKRNIKKLKKLEEYQTLPNYYFDYKIDFIDFNFDNIIFENCKFAFVKFDNTIFKFCRFNNCEFEKCTFNNCTFDNTKIDDSKLIANKFDKCTITNLTFYECNLIKINGNNKFDNCTITGRLAFEYSKLKSVIFNNNNICKIHFYKSKSIIIEFYDNIIDKFIFENCNLIKTRFYQNQTINDFYCSNSKIDIFTSLKNNYKSFNIKDSNNTQFYFIENTFEQIEFDNNINHSIDGLNYYDFEKAGNKIINTDNKLPIFYNQIYNFKILNKSKFNKINTVDELEELELKIGCKTHSIDYWDYFFTDKCKDEFMTKRNSLKFELIKNQYHNFINNIKIQLNYEKFIFIR